MTKFEYVVVRELEGWVVVRRPITGQGGRSLATYRDYVVALKVTLFLQSMNIYEV